jgi:hypothetical protein
MKLAFTYVRVVGGGFLLAVRVFWLRPAVLAFVLLGRLLLGHSVIYRRKWHNQQTNTSKL